MNRNRILNLAHAACKILRVVLLVIFGAYVVMFIHWHFDPDVYEQVKIGNDWISDKNTTGVSMERVSLTITDVTSSGIKPDVGKLFTLGNLTYFSFYLFFMQAVFYLLLSFYIIKEIQKIIQSVQEFDSFRVRNVASFKKIGLYSFLFFIANSFHFAQTTEASFFGLYFHFTPLLFMLASYVLAEVFREGNKLYEEQQLTV